jgi:DNA-binding transcriptional MocR family regulator
MPSVLLIEDDHAGEVAGVALHSAGAGLARWAIVHSVAKSLGPDLRLALLAGDADSLGRVQARQRLGTGWVSHELQRTVAAAYADAGVRTTLHRARDAYAARRHALIEALADQGVAATGASGLNVWVPVADETTVCMSLLAAGYAVQPGARFRHHSGPAVRITVAQLPVRETRAVAAAIARARRTSTWAAS